MARSTEFKGITIPENWIRNTALVCSIGMTFATPQIKQAVLDLEARIDEKPTSTEINVERQSPIHTTSFSPSVQPFTVVQQQTFPSQNPWQNLTFTTESRKLRVTRTSNRGLEQMVELGVTIEEFKPLDVNYQTPEAPAIYSLDEDFDTDPILALKEKNKLEEKETTIEEIRIALWSQKLSRLSQYDDLIESISELYPNIPINKAKALMVIESEGDTHARPYCYRSERYLSSARGLGQFIDRTGRKEGSNSDTCTDDRHEPFWSVPAIFRHLDKLARRYNNQNTAITAGYHTNPPTRYLREIVEIERLLDSNEITYKKATLYSKLVNESRIVVLDRVCEIRELASDYGLSERNFRRLNPQIKPECDELVPGTSYRAPKSLPITYPE